MMPQGNGSPCLVGPELRGRTEGHQAPGIPGLEALERGPALPRSRTHPRRGPCCSPGFTGTRSWWVGVPRWPARRPAPDASWTGAPNRRPWLPGGCHGRRSGCGGIAARFDGPERSFLVAFSGMEHGNFVQGFALAVGQAYKALGWDQASWTGSPISSRSRPSASGGARQKATAGRWSGWVPLSGSQSPSRVSQARRISSGLARIRARA